MKSQNKLQPRLRQRDRWTADEDKLLIQQLQIHGIKGQDLFNIPTKSANQVLEASVSAVKERPRTHQVLIIH
ncbi:SANT/Myb_domain [Hexamita inflata]|uniref:SANT/Myb domain n=1 Tax=Hexamita inflata TaxID=28002 RepID=A0AA86U3Q3_9EUKA|nr:SANT/Myb domain [Hexamita inflata]